MAFVERDSLRRMQSRYVVYRRWMIGGLTTGSVALIGLLLVPAFTSGDNTRMTIYFIGGMLCALGYFVALSQYKSGMRPMRSLMIEAKVWLINDSKQRRSLWAELLLHGTVALILSVTICGLVVLLVFIFGVWIWVKTDSSSNIVAAAFCLLWGCPVALCVLMVHQCVSRVRLNIQKLHMVRR